VVQAVLVVAALGEVQAVLEIRQANHQQVEMAHLRLRIKDLMVVLVYQLIPECMAVVAVVELLLLVVMELQVLAVMAAMDKRQLLQVLP
jgi:hypothetical protein